MKSAAFGKVILLGEHAVVHGVPAIVVGIDRGATAWVTRALGVTSELVLSARERERPISVTRDEPSDLGRAFAALLDACGVKDAVRVEAVTDLPAAAGLGCSAALGVSIVRALDDWLDRAPRPVNETIERAMSWEKVFHGNPSGIDATASARGGCLVYERNQGVAHINEIRFGKPLVLAIGHSGIPSTTRAMVEHVAKLRERKPDMVTQAFEGIRSLVGNARLALEANDHRGLGRLMDLNQMLLSGLMLSTEEIETMCRLAREAGALGVKLTGSGGGGCVVALADGDPEPILTRWESAGFRAFTSRVSTTFVGDSKRSPAP